MENEQKKLKKLRKKEFISIIEDLKSEIQNQLGSNQYLSEISLKNAQMSDKLTEKIQFLNDAQKEPLRCRRIIVGGKGVGKTTLIKELIQQQPNVIVVGIKEEWSDYKHIKKKYSDSFEDLVVEEPQNYLYVIDNVGMMEVNERNFCDWFGNNVLGHDFIISFQGKRASEAFMRHFEVDYMYLFEDENNSLEDFKSLPKISTIFCDNYLKKQSDGI